MIVRTLLLFALLGLAACAETATETASIPAGVDPAGWRLSSGKVPSKAEFTALSATCAAKGGEAEICFKELGLKRVP
jgi:hypothetical protein